MNFRVLAGHAVPLVAALIITADLQAQGLSLGGSSGNGGESVVVEEKAVLSRARRAFSDTAQRLVEETREQSSQSDPRQLERLTAEIETAFEEDLEAALDRLLGDGVLDASETADELGEIHKRHIGDLEGALDAVRNGHSAPPLRRSFTSDLEYTRSLLYYTFVKRNDLETWLLVLAATLGGLVGGWLIRLLLNRLGRTDGDSSLTVLRRSLRRIAGPVYLATAAIGLFIGLQRVWIPGLAEAPVTRTFAATLIAAFFWALWNLSDSIGSAAVRAARFRSDSESGLDPHLVVVSKRLLRILLLVVAAIVAVELLFDSNLTGLLASLGIIGVALSFVLRGTIENIAAGFTIFSDRPFRVGDLLIYEGEWGNVEDIGFRSTRLRTLDGHLFTIPNGKLIDEAIRNVGKRPSIRRRFRLGLTYDTPPEKIEAAISIIEEILEGHQDSLAEPARVVFESYGSYELRLLVQYYFTPPDYWAALELDTKVNLEILRRFAEAGIEFAFPTETTVMTTDPERLPLLRIENGRDSEPSQQSDQRDRRPVSVNGQSDEGSARQMSVGQSDGEPTVGKESAG